MADYKLMRLQLLKEKLSVCFLRPDLIKNLDLSHVIFGFRYRQVRSIDLNVSIDNFTCGFCNHFVKGAHMCQHCHTAYCFTCTEALRDIGIQLRLYQLTVSTDIREFLCLQHMCWSQERLGYRATLPSSLLKIYEGSRFRCDRKYCVFWLSWSEWYNHQHYCDRGPIDDSIDTTIRGPTRNGPQLEEADKLRPRSFRDLQNPALDVPVVTTHEKRIQNRKDEFRYLVENFPNSIHLGEFGATYAFTAFERDNLKENDPIIRYIKIRRPDYQSSWNTKRDKNMKFDLPAFVCTPPTTPPPPDTDFNHIKQTFRQHETSTIVVKDLNHTVSEARQYQYFVARSEQRRMFANRPQPELPPVPNRIANRIRANTPDKVDSWTILSLHHADMIVKQPGYPNGAPTVCWIVITNHFGETVFESFIKHRQLDIINPSSEFHGLNFHDIKYGRSLHLVKQELVPFLAHAQVIIMMDMEATFLALQCSQEEINCLKYKSRDLLKYYSPYLGQKLAYRYIAYLLFDGYDVWQHGRSPANEARIGMWLYLYELPQIEKTYRGLCQYNQEKQRFLPHMEVAKKYIEMRHRIDNGVTNWPSSFTKPYCRRNRNHECTW